MIKVQFQFSSLFFTCFDNSSTGKAAFCKKDSGRSEKMPHQEIMKFIEEYSQTTPRFAIDDIVERING